MSRTLLVILRLLLLTVSEMFCGHMRLQNGQAVRQVTWLSPLSIVYLPILHQLDPFGRAQLVLMLNLIVNKRAANLATGPQNHLIMLRKARLFQG